MIPTSRAEALLSVLRQFFSFGEDDGTKKAAVLLVIAGESSCTSKHVERVLGIDQSTVSRLSVALAGEPDRHGRIGLELIQRYPDPDDSRRLRFALTEAGRKFLATIEQLVVQAAATILHSYSRRP